MGFSHTFFRRFSGSFLLAIGLLSAVRAQQPPTEYPRVVMYQGILHPIVTFSNEAPAFNFKNAYVVGFPVGVNLWKTPRLGYSLEIVPLLRAGDGSSRVTNVLFHPGLLLGLGKGYTLASRLAFETAGRYGLTPVLNKIVRRTPQASYFVAVPLPIRFGNDRPASVTAGFQFGISF